MFLANFGRIFGVFSHSIPRQSSPKKELKGSYAENNEHTEDPDFEPFDEDIELGSSEDICFVCGKFGKDSELSSL